MDKIYGFKQKDVEKLIKYLDGKQGGSLSKAFEEFAAATGKSKGTVRNMYYAVAKKSREDKSFAEKIFRRYADHRAEDFGIQGRRGTRTRKEDTARQKGGQVRAKDHRRAFRRRRKDGAPLSEQIQERSEKQAAARGRDRRGNPRGKRRVRRSRRHKEQHRSCPTPCCAACRTRSIPCSTE